MPKFHYAAAKPTLLHQAATPHLAATLTAAFTSLMQEFTALQHEWKGLESLRATLITEQSSLTIHAIGSLSEDHRPLIIPLHHTPG